MRFPNKEQIELLRKKYPTGTRVELLQMEDMQAPPRGTKEPCMGSMIPAPCWSIGITARDSTSFMVWTAAASFKNEEDYGWTRR